MVDQQRIETYANMLEVGVARLRNPELTLAEKSQTLKAMRGLANRLMQDIDEKLVDNLAKR
jgi:hypothetical protein